MHEHEYALSHTQVEQREVSKVLRNTYGLLAMTLAFSGLWHTCPCRPTPPTRISSWC